MVRIAVVGFGYWGPNLARNFAETDGALLTAVCDAREDVLARAQKRYPGISVFKTFSELLEADVADAIVIATPTSSHAKLAIQAFEAGKHVLVTKPISSTAEEARQMIAAAAKAKRVLLVDHTFVYTGAVQKVRELVEDGSLGDLYYYDSVRINLGLYQHDVSVVWDLAVHDLSILTTWVPKRPRAVSCIAVGHVKGSPHDVGYLTLLYDDSFIAHVTVNWLSPVKVRRMLLGGTKKMVLFDDLDPEEKVKVYDRGITPIETVPGSGVIPVAYRRTGDIWSPQLDITEALRGEAEHFVRCITKGEKPRTDGASGLQVVEILETAEESLRQNGKAVELPASEK
ncbi:MAG: Gfo/Idh/MocA family oxidoreductase [Gemmatimonadaceae bacterium]|nr:Gfo/Idh/MocA family oxidoreductase [Gemmatimonadaceae bacterium]